MLTIGPACAPSSAIRTAIAAPAEWPIVIAGVSPISPKSAATLCAIAGKV